MYRKKLLPTADQKKSRGRKATYCQRLARHLDRLDENPQVWIERQTLPTPPFLNLPAELRQNILYHALEDDEISIPRPNSTTRDLELVCKQFAADLPAVQMMWNKRAAELSKLCGFEKTVMSALIKDMMGPLEVASAALKSQKRLVNTRTQHKASSRRNMQLDGAGITSRRQRQKEATMTVRSLDSIGPRWGQRTASKEENVDMKRWRRARIMASGTGSSSLVIPRSNTRDTSHQPFIAGPLTKKESVGKAAGAKKEADVRAGKGGSHDWSVHRPNTSPGVQRELMLRAYMRSVRDAV